MIDGQVQLSVIPSAIVRTVRTVKPFAKGETTFRMDYGAIAPMDSDEEIARRLVAVRKHVGLNQSEMADRLNIAKNTLNGFEKAKRSLTLETAKRIRQRFGISVDWLLFGDIGQPSQGIAIELGPNPGQPEPAAKPEKRRRPKAA
jgi:transcriptional regulator with XRE-family HTH domain